MGNLPLFIAAGLGLIWVACIFSGMGSLYRRGSPLFIVYWGTWMCFALWYQKMVKVGRAETSGFVYIILISAITLGILFYFFGGTESARDARVKKR